MNTPTFTIPVPAQQKPVRFVRIEVPVRYDEEDMPADFPGRVADAWACYVDLATGEWGLSLTNGELGMIPQVEHLLHMKVCDEGTYKFIDEHNKIVRNISQDYVPSFFPGKHYGDYLIFSLGEGKIRNWNVAPREWQCYWEEHHGENE